MGALAGALAEDPMIGNSMATVHEDNGGFVIQMAAVMDFCEHQLPVILGSTRSVGVHIANAKMPNTACVNRTQGSMQFAK